MKRLILVASVALCTNANAIDAQGAADAMKKGCGVVDGASLQENRAALDCMATILYICWKITDPREGNQCFVDAMKLANNKRYLEQQQR